MKGKSKHDATTAMLPILYFENHWPRGGHPPKDNDQVSGALVVKPLEMPNMILPPP